MQATTSMGVQADATPGSAEEAAKKTYAAPQLTSWGSIIELTKGPINGVVDGFFSGTGGA